MDQIAEFHTPASVMFSTLTRRAPAPNVARSLKKLLPNDLPPSLEGRPGNLYEVLSRKPDGGVGREIHQTRWNNKQIEGSYWVVTRSKFKCEGKHGKIWGLLHWKGESHLLLRYRENSSLQCYQAS